MPQQSRFLYRGVTLIDTSAVVAIHDEREVRHKEAKFFFEQQKAVTWTSINVTAHETFTRVRYETDVARALMAFSFLRTQPVRFVTFEAEDEKQALALLTKYSDHKLSFHDALCAAVMRRLGIYKVFTFDRDFLTLGFEVLPGTVI